jgi:hypothetical protein
MCFVLLSSTKVYGSLFFLEKTITGIMYLDIPEKFLILLITNDSPQRNLGFQQGGAPSHFHADV